MTLKIQRFRPPAQGSYGWAVLDLLASSWYFKGLSIKDLCDLMAATEKQLRPVMADLSAQGMIEQTAFKGWAITQAGRNVVSQ